MFIHHAKYTPSHYTIDLPHVQDAITILRLSRGIQHTFVATNHACTLCLLAYDLSLITRFSFLGGQKSFFHHFQRSGDHKVWAPHGPHNGRTHTHGVTNGSVIAIRTT